MLGRPGAGVPELVVVPGLGALGYLLPTARVCATWTRVHLLDLPGSGWRRTARLPADLAAVSGALAGWLAQVPAAPVLLLGHSTGAQAALRAALSSPAAVSCLVLGGATFTPEARRPTGLVVRTALTVVHERPGELPAVLPYYLRGARRLPELLRSATADRPEDVVGALVPPLLVLRGRHDRLCSRGFAQELARRAPRGEVVELPGSHNVPWTHPQEVSQALRAASLSPAPRRP